uniref:NADH dehydrogenase subunit 6 n=1 Tax=Electrogena lateralis TaxID=940667 RepID=UPI0020282C1B|nr:NADH dehydrogenase subunit 6 [Electrogena lateralis]UPL65068.1 NADH dehydrogenase subunit 6 [Electrogena lateralis]
MSQLILLFSSLMVGLTFMTMNHPLAMGLILLLQTLLIALLTGLLAPSFWFSYILFLVFLGGMLVLFIYVTSLASNEMFSISSQTMLNVVLFMVLIMGFSLINDPLSMLSPETPEQLTNPQLYLTTDIGNLLLKLYSSPSYYLTLLLVCYLFLTLIAVVTVTQIYEGPLRSKN